MACPIEFIATVKMADDTYLLVNEARCAFIVESEKDTNGVTVDAFGNATFSSAESSRSYRIAGRSEDRMSMINLFAINYMDMWCWRRHEGKSCHFPG